ncbi:MAG: histidinol-phosphatase [Eubacterium sp.]
MYNYHTHTRRCNHAIGEDREYVEKAIEGGIAELGFSDHAPYIFPNRYESDFRMHINEIEDYIKSIENLKKEYSKDINIYVGFELEYYPRFHDKQMEFLDNYPYDYLILGQHFIGNEYENESVYSGFPTKNPKHLEMYVNQVMEGIATGRFSYVAHPDVINYKGSRQEYQKAIKRICQKAKSMKIPLEYNMLGYMQKRHYPNKICWDTIAESRCDVVIGYDAHSPKVLGNTNNYIMCRKELLKMGITPLDNYKIIAKCKKM